MNLGGFTNCDAKGARFFYKSAELIEGLVSVADSCEYHGKIDSRDDGCVGMPQELFSDVRR